MRKRTYQKGDKTIYVNVIAGTYIIRLTMDANDTQSFMWGLCCDSQL